MITIADEIKMVLKEIKRISIELETIDPKDPDNRFKYANKKSELNCLYKKLQALKEIEEQEIKTKNNYSNNNDNVHLSVDSSKKIIPLNNKILKKRIKKS